MNLLSTGNQFIEMDFTQSNSTLIIGENGAGKSSFIEALTFVLYNKPFRNINKPQLINSITGKGLLVEIEFDINKKKYLVRRGMKPNIFEIYQNDKLINQNSDNRDYQEMLEKQILKLNFKSFSQIVVLGSANYTPFMQLPAQHRRNVVEDLLDIQVFSIMNSLLKEKMTQNKTDLSDVDYQINLCAQAIELHQKHVDSLKQNNDELIQKKRDKIAEHEANISILNDTVATLITEIDDLSSQIADQEKIDAKKNKLVTIESALSERMKKLNKEIQFFHDHDNCPTCKQGIDHDFKTNTITSRTTKLEEVKIALDKLEKEIDSSHARLNIIANINKDIQKLNQQVMVNNNQITFLNNNIGDLNDEIDHLLKQSKKIDNEVKDSNKHAKKLQTLIKSKENLLKEKNVHEVASFLLKDNGIKTKIIRQYIPIMNKLINKYLAALDFMCDFHLDESFNETIKSRFRDEFTYASFSEGEKTRLDLALMMTWRAIAKLRNSASTNLLIMDEIFDGSLDASGTEELVSLIQSITGDSNVFVISHRSADVLYDKFQSVIRFEKHGNFSRIAA